MNLVVGLGPIGGSVGAHLAELGRPVQGLDLSAERARTWAAATGAPGYSSFGEVSWPDIDTIVIAVRTADQVAAVIESVNRHASTQNLAVFVVTTLAPEDARTILGECPANWRIFEAPVSGGPSGARDGSMTVMLAGPAITDTDQRLLDDICGRVFHADGYGTPALLKLLNNALATYNLLATARMIALAEEHGVSASSFLDLIRTSTGHSWMSDHFTDVAQDLLVKDVKLLKKSIGGLPVLELDDATEGAILDARGRLSASK